jgi:membrane associated rhomboid family serine protease
MGGKEGPPEYITMASGADVKQRSSSGFLRLLIAYVVGLNAFGLVLALTFAIGSLLHMANAVALTGVVVGIAVAIAVGWRVERATKRLFQ